jgi:hypothetical protein
MHIASFLHVPALVSRCRVRAGRCWARTNRAARGSTGSLLILILGFMRAIAKTTKITTRKIIGHFGGPGCPGRAVAAAGGRRPGCHGSRNLNVILSGLRVRKARRHSPPIGQETGNLKLENDVLSRSRFERRPARAGPALARATPGSAAQLRSSSLSSAVHRHIPSS